MNTPKSQIEFLKDYLQNKCEIDKKQTSQITTQPWITLIHDHVEVISPKLDDQK